MDAEQVYESLMRALRREREAREAAERDLRSVRARFEHLYEVLEGKGVLGPGHRRLNEKLGAQAEVQGPGRKVRLRQYIDKYQIEGADIDCAARIHLCQARCCSFTFPLSPQDLDEGGVRWDVEDPYMIRHDEDGYCSHLDRGTLGCTIHQRRPATCRQYDCRQDPRVWVDFEARVPAPPLLGWTPPGSVAGHDKGDAAAALPTTAEDPPDEAPAPPEGSS